MYILSSGINDPLSLAWDNLEFPKIPYNIENPFECQRIGRENHWTLLVAEPDNGTREPVQCHKAPRLMNSYRV